MNALKQKPLTHLANIERRVVLAFINKVQQQFGDQLISATLFGSRARGESEPDSDMDILVIMSKADPQIRRTIHYLAAEVWLEYGIFLSTLVWGQDHWRELAELQTSLYQNIYRDGIDLLALVASTA